MTELEYSNLEKLMKEGIEAINKRLDKLPCSDHSLSINTLETQRDAEKEQKKDSSDSRDWILRIGVFAVGLLVFLDKVGFFKSLSR